jgi:hypothetical protein
VFVKDFDIVILTIDAVALGNIPAFPGATLLSSIFKSFWAILIS